jgi:hypothetical protein
VGGVTITISGMPEGAVFKAKPVEVEVDGQLVLAAFDITIYVDNVEWQPGEDDNIVVTFDIPELADVDEVTVYHMEDLNAEPEYVDTVSVPGTAAAFTAESFSVYYISVTNNGYAKDVTFYTTGKGQPVTVTYSKQTSKGSGRPTAPTLPADNDYLKFSNLAEAGVDKGLLFWDYYKWTFTVTLTDQANYNNTKYTFDIGGTTYTVEANNTNWDLDDFRKQGVSHIDIRQTNATVNITTIVKNGSQEVGRSTETAVPARVTKVNSITINQYTGEIHLGTDRDDEFRYTFGSNIFGSNLIGIYKNDSPRVITVNVNLETEDGRTISNVPVTFTPDDMLAAILNCDSFINLLGIASGMDFYIRNAQAEIYTQVTTGTGSDTITISGTKTWNHGTNPPNSQPTNASLTLTLYKDGGEVKGTDGQNLKPTWDNNDRYTFTVPYESHETVYTVSEAPVAGYTTTASGAGTGYHTGVGTTIDVTNNNNLVYNLSNANFIIAKLTQNNGYMIWTARSVAESEKTDLITAANANEKFQNATIDNTTFISGDGAVYDNPSKGTATLNYSAPNITITFSAKSVWTYFSYGTMTTAYTPQNGNFTNTYKHPDVPGDKGFFEVKKVDAEHNAITLEGAIFTLVKDDGAGTLVAEKQTGEDGIATFDNLEDGDYILTERYAPADYSKDWGDWGIKVIDGIVYMDQEVINTLVVENDQKPGKLTVTKTVTGNRATLGQKFDFTVTLANMPSFAVKAVLLDTEAESLNKPADGTWSTDKGQSGTWSFEQGHMAVIHVQLVAGETLTVNGLTPWMTYDVQEALVSGYTPSATVNGQTVTLMDGAIPQGRIGDNEQEVIPNPVVIFTNDAGNSSSTDRDRDRDRDRDNPIEIPEVEVPLDPGPGPEVEVPEVEVPLVETPEVVVDIPNEVVPLGDRTTPQTGDESALAFWVTLFVLCGGMLGFLVTGLRKKD